MPSRRRLLLAVAGGLALAACGRRRKMEGLPAGAVVLALGDSLTWGIGATPETSYPAVLAGLTGWQVVNAGVPGDTSAAALARLPALLQEHSPRLVIVGIGGNDFLRRLPPAETRDNIRRICRDAAASGAQVLLVAIPELSMLAAVARSLSDHPMYEELATELGVPLHEGGWAKVLGDPALRSDAIHANAQGYEAFARGLAARARELGLAPA
ncbi:arylesterase [Ramlibacter sp. RBP-2]|uniref:Arylesterase n=1 Tax=Ramlibacter lithotrophicus TaxID=2606681 RepID=A0A7X6I5K1_9BURK|nr:GDSL-type esterase/lipase family protein [Ramlibacter lithotrophicus]NKE65441.1 arylesterase [Ramlibacter lithotrophicus]